MKTLEQLLEEVRRQHPEETDEQHIFRAQFRFDRLNEEKPVPEPETVAPKVEHQEVVIPDYSVYLKAIIAILLLLCLLSAKSAFGQLDGIVIQKDGAKQKTVAGGFATLNFSGATVSCSGNVCTITAGDSTTVVIPYKGAWSGATTYAQNDVVTSSGSSYVSLQDSNSGHAVSDGAWWGLLASKGDTGATGAKGDKGDTGATGAAGANGADGANGVGVPVGGTTGQVLAKASDTDYDTGWTDAGSSYPGCTSDSANGITCTGKITAESIETTGTGYSNFASKTDSTTTGDFWRNGDNIKWRGTSTTYTAATTADLTNYVPTSLTVAGKALSGNITLACSDLSDEGDACAKSVGTGATNVAAGDHTHTGMSVEVASGTVALGTGSIAANACATAVALDDADILTTDTIQWTPDADISGVTGYTPAGTLRIYPYPTAGHANFKVCNGSATDAVTPGAVTLNVRVTR